MSILKASLYLKKHDPILGRVIEKAPLQQWKRSNNYFLDLVSSIINQQLSDKAADTIYKRFEHLFDGAVTPEKVLALSSQDVRNVGISWSKVSYIRDLADKVIKSDVVFEHLETLLDEEVIIELTKIKGIGRWTAEMFLMFSMGRPDVFSYGDVGLQNAIKRLYKLSDKPTKEQAENISTVWKPYRTIACRYLWKSLDHKL